MFILIFTGFLVKKLYLHETFLPLVSQVYGTKRGSYNYEKGFLCPSVLASISRAGLGYHVPRLRERYPTLAFVSTAPTLKGFGGPLNLGSESRGREQLHTNNERSPTVFSNLGLEKDM